MIKKIFDNSQYRYVIANTLVSVISFGRNLLFMKTVNLAELGQVAMMQTIILLVSFAQAGVLNGAYILFAERKEQQDRQIISFLNLAAVVLFLVAGIGFTFGAGRLMAPLVTQETMILSVLAGIVTLISTWMNSALVAKRRLGLSNALSIAGAVASLGIAAFTKSYGIHAALIALLVQPLIFVIIALGLEKNFRAISLQVEWRVIRETFAIGVMQFAAMLTLLLTYQVERWMIIYQLGPKALGEFYLVMMYSTFFLLIPASLMNVHFPPAMKALQDGDGKRFWSIRKRHITELVTYGFVSFVLTATLLPTIVRHLAPQFNGSIYLVLLGFPAFYLYVLRDPPSLVLYSMKRTLPGLESGAAFVILYALLLAGAALLGRFSLGSVVVLRGVAVAVSTGFLYIRQRSYRADKYLLAMKGASSALPEIDAQFDL
jgi:O-antigen/teichoic acid export membrane protein